MIGYRKFIKFSFKTPNLSININVNYTAKIKFFTPIIVNFIEGGN